MDNTVIQIGSIDAVKWVAGADCRFTVADSTAIWRIRISSNVPFIDSVWMLLNTNEQERANRYYRELDKQRFIINRAGLRILLGKYLDLSPTEIEFAAGENEKPFIQHSHLHYNVSHSGDFVLIAISDSDVGVDVEKPDAALHYNEIMQISFSALEIEYVKSSATPIELFYLLWTRKEALLKATGKGIDDDLKHIPSVDGGYQINDSLMGSPKNWIVNSFKVNDRHIASIATNHTACTFWELNF